MESVASSSATSHDIRHTRTLCLFRHLGARLSRCSTSAEARRTFCFTHIHRHTLCSSFAALSQRAAACYPSLLYSRSVACKCGECNMQRASAVDPPASVSFLSPLPLPHHPLPRLTSSLLRCSASLSATVTHLLCFSNSHTFVCVSLRFSPSIHFCLGFFLRFSLNKLQFITKRSDY